MYTSLSRSLSIYLSLFLFLSSVSYVLYCPGLGQDTPLVTNRVESLSYVTCLLCMGVVGRVVGGLEWVLYWVVKGGLVRGVCGGAE